MIICIGPFCIPVYALLPFLWAFVMQWKEWVFEKLGVVAKKETIVEEEEEHNGKPLPGNDAGGLHTNYTEVKNDREESVTKNNKVVIVITSKEQYDELLKTNEKLIVMNTASWCGPCKKIYPLFNKLSEQYNNIQFVKVDVDDMSEVAERYKINAMPTFVGVHNGAEKRRVVGAHIRDLEELAAKL